MDWLLWTLSIAALWHCGQGEMIARCLPGWEDLRGSDECFTLPNLDWKKPWSQAREFCKGRDGDSLMITDQATKNYANQTIWDAGITGSIYLNAKKVNEKWTWQEDQSDVDMELLPLAADPSTGNCGTLNPYGKLKGVKCSDKHPFMCHRDISLPPLCDHSGGWDQYNDHCYLSSKEGKMWNESLSICEVYGGSLMTINGVGEQRFAFDHAHYRNSYLWIGISEVGHAGTFSWADGDPRNYSDWQADQPSTEFGGKGAGVIDKDAPGGAWTVQDGTTTSNDYICETEQSGCAYGWEEFEDSCYYFNTELTDVYVWEHAKETCDDVGAHLLVIETEEENSFIIDHIVPYTFLWIGLSSVPNDKFSWVDGVPMEFSHMSDADKEAALASGVTKCVYFTVTNPDTGELSWIPSDCHAPQTYICEAMKGDDIHMIHPKDMYCPEGWMLSGESCYFFSQEERIWNSAQTYCKNQYPEAHLVSIGSWSEQDFIHCNAQTDIFIGLTDSEVEGTFTWSDGAPVDILNWADGEPNGGAESNCCRMYQGIDGKWDDYDCQDSLDFVCELAASDSPFGPPVPTTTPEPPFSEDCGGFGWLENPNTGECYYIFLDEQDYYSATESCKALDYAATITLLSLGTGEESAFLSGYLQEHHYSWQSFYIGFTNNDYGMVWDDGSPVGFLNFIDSEPSGYEPCGELYTDSGKWNDITCDIMQAFICEKKGPNYTPIEPSPPLDPICPDGWNYYNFHCYYFYNTKIIYNNAKAWCESHLDSSLVSIQDSIENEYINGMAQSMGMNVWLGLHDDGAGNNWYWEDGSNLEDYKNWNETQPDNFQGNEHCGQLDTYLGGHWNDRPCSDQTGFVCKITIDICPQGWKYHNKKCYYTSEIPKVKEEARQECKDINTNSDLVTITSDEENDYFYSIVSTTCNTWIGYTFNPDTQTWFWDDGNTFNYTHWATGEPNNLNTELCTEINSINTWAEIKLWNNVPCDNAKNVGCEYFPTHYLGCEDGWMDFDGACYYFDQTTEYMTFDDAVSMCSDKGAQLISIHSEEENDFVYSNVPIYESTWIGLSTKGQEGSLAWSDGTTLTYTKLDTLSGYNMYEPMCASISADTMSDSSWILSNCDYGPGYGYARLTCKMAAAAKKIDPVDSGCQNNDLYFKGSCYNIPYQKNATWDEAKATCEANSANLIRIQYSHEGAFISANLGDFGSDVWTDAKVHRYQDESVDFIFDNGKFVNYLPWDGGDQPDLTKGDCILATGEAGHSGFYQITACESKLSFICEYDREGYTPPPPEPTPTHGTFCYDGWDHFKGHCYKAFADVNKWQDAEDKCLGFGGHLASINSENEEQEILSVIQQSSIDPYSKQLWVGLQLNTLADKHWTDGSAINFLHWDTDQPEMHDHENCASVNKDSVQLTCSVCESHLPYVCEAKEGAMVTTPAPPTMMPPPKCSDDWYLYKDHCYKFISAADNDAQSWDQARKLCREEGSYLTSVLDIDENYFIEAMIAKMSDSGVWLGGRSTEDAGFAWVDGSPYAYESWEKGEPNHCAGQEDCIVMNNHHLGKWNDQNCGHVLGRVCKKPFGVTFPTQPPTLPPVGNCPKDWVTVSVTGRCFKFVDEARMFDDAVAGCKDLRSDAKLVSIHSNKELAYITAGLGILGKKAWNGLKLQSGEYVWVDQTTVEYTPWAPGEPNGKETGTEDCGESLYPSGLMNDISGLEWNPYICAIKRDPSITEPSTLPKCDSPFDNYFKYKDDCFRMEKTQKSWQDAEQACKDEGAHLASADNINQNAFMWILGQDPDTQHPWIGLNNIKDKNLYEWTDDWPVFYANWGTDEPQVNATDKNCVRINSDDGSWYNEKCDQTRSFLCRYSKDPAPSPPPPVEGHCPEGDWMNVKGSYCYMYVGQSMSWNDANGYCMHLDANMTSLHSDDQNSLLYHLVKEKHVNAWIGLIQKSKGMGWSDGTAYDYNHWHESEPSSDDEQCTEFYASDGTWNDLKCDTKRTFICQTAKIPDVEPTNPSVPPTHEFDTTTTTDGGGGGGGGGGGDGLSGGAIFGIVFAVLVVFVSVGFVGFSYIKKKQVNSGAFYPSMSSSQVNLDPIGGGTDA